MQTSEFVDKIINEEIHDEELKKLLITHSECVARKSLAIADSIGLDVDRQFVWDAAMLHDIGVVECDAPGIHCCGDAPYISHGPLGAAILARHGLPESYCRVCERHTGAGLPGHEPETLEEKLICYADKFFSKSANPAAEKPLDRVLASMARFGQENTDRFLALHKLFAPQSC